MRDPTMPRPPAPLAVLLVALLALLAIGAGLSGLERSSRGVTVEALTHGRTPVTVFRPAGLPADGAAPVVLIAHGFAGSQQLMQPFALTLARNGFEAITFDFPGHGRHPEPMRGGLSDPEESLRVLLASMEELRVLAAARSQARGQGGRYAVIGHSMASDIVVRHAQRHADVVATVAVSLFAPSIGPQTPPDSPRNLLVIDGALEPDMMAREALRVLARSGTAAGFETTVGRFADGTARRATLAPGAEHIGVLYRRHTQVEALAWLQAAFGRPAAPSAGSAASAPEPFVDARGPWLGWLLLGVVALAWPLAQALPRPATLADVGAPDRIATPVPRRRSWRSWTGEWPRLLLPAVATPLLLRLVPTDLLPILLGDYLVLHFALYAALIVVVDRLLDRRDGATPLPVPIRLSRPALVVASAAASAWLLLSLGLPLDRYVFNVVPIAVRLPVVAAMCAGTLAWFWADECHTRSPAAARGAFAAGKLAFLLSLVLAIALDPQRLFFLAIIVPAILLLFLVFGLFSRWIFRRTGDPRVAATAQGLALGSFIAVTFPLVG